MSNKLKAEELYQRLEKLTTEGFFNYHYEQRVPKDMDKIRRIRKTDTKVCVIFFESDEIKFIENLISEAENMIPELKQLYEYNLSHPSVMKCFSGLVNHKSLHIGCYDIYN